MTSHRLNVSGRSLGGTAHAMRAVRILAKEPHAYVYYVVSQGKRQMEMAAYVSSEIASLRKVFPDCQRFAIHLEDMEGKLIEYTGA